MVGTCEGSKKLPEPILTIDIDSRDSLEEAEIILISSDEDDLDVSIEAFIRQIGKYGRRNV